VGLYAGPQPSDDAYITLRYARSLAEGDGSCSERPSTPDRSIPRTDQAAAQAVFERSALKQGAGAAANGDGE